MRVRVATDGVKFVVVQEPMAKTDREGRQRVDTRSGALLWQVALVPIGDDYLREAITVTVDSEPSVRAGDFVGVVDLVAATWETEGRWGVAFRAAKIAPAAAATTVRSAASPSTSAA